MYRVLMVLLSVMLFVGIAQARTTNDGKLLTAIHKNKLVIVHKVKSGETLFMLARRYHVPPAMLADANGLNYQSSLGKTIFIPLGAYNRLKVLPSNLSEARTLYYKIGRYDNLFIIAKYVGVKQKVLQGWNAMADNNVKEGQLLKVGWVLFDGTQKPFAKKDSLKKATEGKDGNNTVKYGDGVTVITLKPKDSLSKIHRRYITQTSNETFVVEDKGTAVFFPMSVKKAKIYYAFHDKAARGTIVKVVNPGTNMFVFAKVLGPLPQTKQYHNAVIGISETAKEELGITDDKAWCELYYSPRP
ncbi:MAG: LysM peptidoglycan-binding domain-containing protein [Flavipsychrobacter sp.]